jgi:RNA processing factor Prp31
MNVSGTFIGVSAQAIENLIPYAVTKVQRHGFSDFRIMTTDGLLYTAINAIKDIDSETELLKQKVRDLESEVKNLKDKLDHLHPN